MSFAGFSSWLRRNLHFRGNTRLCYWEASRLGHYLVILSILALSLANLAGDLVFAKHVKHHAALRDPPLSTYSFIEDDYPPRLLLPSTHNPSVLLTLEETTRYAPSASHPSSESRLEWAYASADGDANVRLGPPRRKFFFPAFSYELHCLRVVGGALQQDSDLHSDDVESRKEGRERAHVERCLSVLRQFALCDADVTLEDASSLERDFERVRVAGERRCRDWTVLYEAIGSNWEEWRRFREATDDA